MSLIGHRPHLPVVLPLDLGHVGGFSSFPHRRGKFNAGERIAIPVPPDGGEGNIRRDSCEGVLLRVRRGGRQSKQGCRRCGRSHRRTRRGRGTQFFRNPTDLHQQRPILRFRIAVPFCSHGGRIREGDVVIRAAGTEVEELGRFRGPGINAIGLSVG